MKQLQKTKYDSIKLGALPKGCQLCVKGQKTVVFITGICSRKCFYCPISDKKNQKDVIYANEWQLKDINDKNLHKEIALTDAKGAGITGGDPLARFERTVKLIKQLKKKYSKQFHIHLYTPLLLITEQKLKQLEEAGLDEIRFHPDLENKKHWHKLSLLKQIKKIKKGIEIPVVPGWEKQIKELIDEAKNYITFINLNELEISDTNANHLVKRGYKAKDDISYGVKQSEESAKKLLTYIQKTTKLNAHYCSTTLKDRHQLGNRLMRRAKNVMEPFDALTEDAMLLRGAIYKHLPPKNKITTQKQVEAMKRFMEKLKQEHDIPSELIKLDKQQKRILTMLPVVQELKEQIKKEKYIPTILAEYPTEDALIVELEQL